MFTSSKPPKKPILKHPKSQMSLSTKKVSFESSNRSLESSPGLQKSKALRNTIYKNFLEEQQSFENLRNLVNLRKIQSTGATIGDSERDEHLSDIDLTQAKLEDSHAPEQIEEHHEEMEHVEDKENHSHLANEREYDEHAEQPADQMSYLEVKNPTQPQESMDLSNSSRVSVPQLNEQANGPQTPNKQEEDHNLQVITEGEAPQVQITTPHGSQKPMENNASGDKSRLWASLSNLSLNKNQNNSQKYRSVSDVANEAIKQSHLSQFGKKKYEEEHSLQEEPQQSIRLDEDLKASMPESHLSNIQIDRPNMDPLVASGDKLDSHRSFKDVPAYNPEHGQENYMSLVDQSLDHPNEENYSDKKKSRLAYLTSKEETPWSMVLDRSLRKVQESHVARSVNVLQNDDLDLNLERLRELRFRYEGKTSDGPSGVEKVLDISRILAMRSSLQNEQPHDDEESLRRHEESERLRKEEEEKQIRREAGAQKFEFALEKIIAKINEEDLQEGFEGIREEYYEQLELIRLSKISRGFEKLDQGILNDRTFLSIGLEELKEHLNQCLINQHAQDFREKMLAYNSLMALKEYALHVKRKLAKEAQAKQHFRYNKLRKTFDTIQQHSASCKEWLENVKSELRLLKKSKIFDAWRADAREQKINRLTDQLIEKKQMILKQKIVNFWKDETIQQYRIPLQKGVRRYKFRLVKRAFKFLKAYAVKRNISKENNMKAYLFMMEKLTKKAFSGLVPFYMKEQTRKLNVDDYEDFIPLRICIKDKVTKISSEDKDWASLNNERRVMIDVVKNKNK